MNIGIDARVLQGTAKTGIGEYAEQLIKAVLALDDVNRYFIFTNSSRPINLPRLSLKKNIPTANFHYPNKFFNLSILTLKQPRLDNLLAKKYAEKIDCWFSPHFNFTALTPTVFQILTVHDLSFELFPEFFTTKQRWWHRAVLPAKQCLNANQIIVPSQNTKNDLIDRYHLPAGKITVIYPGCSPIFDDPLNSTAQKIQEIKTKYQLPEEFILFLGTVEPRKNITAIIDAFTSISSQLPGLHLVVAGGNGWKNHSLYEGAAKSTAAAKIKFIGWVKDEEKPALYQSAASFIYPSFYEGFGFPVLEAMRAGTPVITSDRSSLPEITADAALLINPLNSADIAEKILLVMTKPEIKNRLIAAGKIQSKKFSWGQAALAWLQLLPKIRN